MTIERLESRIAPAALTGGNKILTYTDIDGDAVKVTFTVAMNASDFTFIVNGASQNGITGAEGATSLDRISLLGHPGAGFTVVATPAAGKGDGFANIGTVDGTGTQLGAIRIDGDLSVIQAGEAATLTAGSGLKSLTVHSLGREAATVTESIIHNPGSIKIETDMLNSELMTFGHMRSFIVGGSLLGTDQGFSANFQNTNAHDNEPQGIDVVRIGGSLIGDATSSAIITLQGSTNGAVKSFMVGGSVIGSAHDATGQIVLGNHSGTVVIGGDIIGGTGGRAGELSVSGSATSISVGGSVRGSTANQTGMISCGSVRNVMIGHDIVGGDHTTAGALSLSGVLFVSKIGNLSVGGALIAGHNSGGGTMAFDGAIEISGQLGTAKIGEIVGNATHRAEIYASGIGVTGLHGGTTGEQAIEKLTIAHSMTDAAIVTGYTPGNAAGNLDAGAGSITIGGDFAHSYISVGLTLGTDGIAGTTDDSFATNHAVLGLIKVAGAVAGTPASGDEFDIAATKIAKVQIGKATLTGQAIHANSFYGADQDVFIGDAG